MLPEQVYFQGLEETVARALAEDIGPGDVTADLIDPEVRLHARVLLKEPAVICGRPWFNETFYQLDETIDIDWHCAEGSRQPAGTVLCTLTGNARHLLSGERTALNFLQLLSGTATTTRRYADALAGTATQVLDTRKTVPGLRLAQKYAVACGGGHNHRLGLYDRVLIKENHILAAGSIRQAVDAARRRHPDVLIEVETENLDEFAEALETSVDVIMLDEFTPEEMRHAVAMNGGRKKLEISGGVTLDNIRALAETGVDYISVGALTKHVRAIDLSMRFTWQGG